MRGVPAAERAARASARGQDGATVVMVVLFCVFIALIATGNA